MPATAALALATAEKDEWCDYDALEELDQMELYEREQPPAYMRDYHSPIPYWIGKLPISVNEMVRSIWSGASDRIDHPKIEARPHRPW